MNAKSLINKRDQVLYAKVRPEIKEQVKALADLYDVSESIIVDALMFEALANVKVLNQLKTQARAMSR